MTVMHDPRPALARLKLPKDFEPAWDLVSLYPPQGEWTDHDYLSFVKKLDTHRLIELVDGRIEVLPVPTEEHQSIVAFLYEALVGFVRPRKLGKVLFTGLRVRLRSRNFREPDVVFLSKKNEGKRGSRYWSGADLSMEVVSKDDPDRDYVDKRREYARAGIREYWIVDPRDRTITLLVLKGRSYTRHGVYKDGQKVTSVLLSGFAMDVSAVFDAANE
jgi:Uma2 family endonuclease